MIAEAAVMTVIFHSIDAFTAHSIRHQWIHSQMLVSFHSIDAITAHGIQHQRIHRQMLVRSENLTKKTAYEQNNAGEKYTNLYYTTDQQAFHKFLHT